jgi:hypothetical protein|tara:strand:- start:10 stop:261 length:252 start_codon:yes stop_codon:yes gene_type:complete
MSKELIKIANELSNKDMCDLINIFSDRIDVFLGVHVKGDKKIQVSFQLSKERPCSLNGACLQLNSEWTDTEDCLIPINEWIKD